MMNGSLRARFDANQSIDSFEWITSEHCEYISLNELKKSVVESPDLKQSPNMSKGANKRAQQQRQKEQQASKDQTRHVAMPKTLVGDWGLTASVMQCLEVREMQ